LKTLRERADEAKTRICLGLIMELLIIVAEPSSQAVKTRAMKSIEALFLFLSSQDKGEIS
jgi:hypothetical protein